MASGMSSAALIDSETVAAPADADSVDDCGSAEDEAKAIVYYNDLIMHKIISYVNLLQDRKNIECSSHRLRRISQKAPFKSNEIDNTVLDLSFMMVGSTMSICVAGNEIQVPAMTSNIRRSSSGFAVTQPEECVAKTREVFSRFARQILQVKIGGIPDFERRLGYIIDHQLVLSLDLCTAFDILSKVKAVAFRNCCLLPEVISHWSGSECTMMHTISSLCFHSIWFDRVEDCDRFVGIVSGNLRRLYLSDCSAKTVINIMKRIRALRSKLEFIYVAVDYRTFRSTDAALEMLTEVTDLTHEIHICACTSHFVPHRPYRILINFVSSLSNFKKLTTLEVDLGPIRRFNFDMYEHFFTGLYQLDNLRVFRLSGHPFSTGSSNLRRCMIYSMSRLTQIKEFAIFNLVKNFSHEEVTEFCNSLPPNITILSLNHCRYLSDRDINAIAQQCPKIMTLFLRDMRSMTSVGVVNALTAFKNLKRFGVCSTGPITGDAYRALADWKLAPNIEAAIIGGNRDPLNDEVVRELQRRFAQFNMIGVTTQWFDCEYHMWRTRDDYQALLASCAFAECPRCDKDVTLISDEDYE